MISNGYKEERGIVGSMFSTLIHYSRRKPTFAQQWVKRKKLNTLKNANPFTPYPTLIQSCQSIEQLEHMKELIDLKMKHLHKREAYETAESKAS